MDLKELHKKVRIGELWFTPRIFSESKKDLCEDAKVFKNEAMRRVNLAIQKNGKLDSGDRVRIIGYDKLLDEKEFAGFPEELLTYPGNSITELDGEDYSNEFNAFIHGPEIDNSDDDRNDTSLTMQVKLIDGENCGQILLFGDVSNETIREIFDRAKENKNEEYLNWTVFLAPHHCSKTVMYKKDEDGNEIKDQEILDDLDNFQCNDGIIVSSSEKIPDKNESGDNPPHIKAKKAYVEVANGGFLCTHEDGEVKEPLVFTISASGFICVALTGTVPAEGDISDATTEARGKKTPPKNRVTFG